MATTISFQEGANPAVVFRAPSRESAARPNHFQRANATVGGRIDVSDLGDGSTLDQPHLVWNDKAMLPDADHTALETFVKTTVNFKEKSFTYTDYNSNTFTVRYWGGLETFTPARSSHWIGLIELREVPT